MIVISEPRPTYFHVAAIACAAQLKSWMEKRGIPLPRGLDHERVAFAALTSAPDAYRIAVFTQAKWGWQAADTELVLLFHAAFNIANQEHFKAVQAWVMRTGVRFPALPRETVFFHQGDKLRRGIVTNVLPSTAEAVVVMVDKLDQRGRSAETIRVLAEEVVFDPETAADADGEA